MRDVNRFASALLSPFWLVGRVLSAFAVGATWIWEAFNEGLNTDRQVESPDVGALCLVWLTLLTVWVIFW